MSAITTRSTGTTGVGGVTRKDAPLSNTEIDNNFININTDKLEITDTTSTNTANKVVKRDANGDFSASTVTLTTMNSTNATVTNLSATSITETSSITLKENISPIHGVLGSISALNPVTYDRKDGSTKNEAGLIAEEVFKIIPNLVQLDEHGKPMGIHYTKLTAYLVEAVKELKTELDTLKGIK